MKKYLAYALIGAGIVGILGAGTVFAQAQFSEGKYPTIIDKLVERFDLDPEEVKEVFEENREERFENMQAHLDERLDKAVEAGKITEEQKELILAKKSEMIDRMKELKDLSPEERKEQMQETREEMKAWAEENGIDPSFCNGKGPGRGMIKGMHKGAGRGDSIKDFRGMEI